ncbi:MAG: hypothetical protein IRZ15_11670 [Bryobacteraceae bacterium]|nr:hypothetical protein [Bryobacteraceae bacterium]
MFAYWFRYSCLLILRTAPAKDYAGQVAEANQLNFREVQRQLQTEEAGRRLDDLYELLQRDYKFLSYLLSGPSRFPFRSLDIEQKTLAVDYALVQVWYWIGRRFSLRQSRLALEEMSSILNHFAQTVGERVELLSRS